MSSVDAYLLQVDRRQGLFVCIGLCRIRLTFVDIPVRMSVLIDESIETRVLDGKVFDGDLTTKKVIEWLQRQGCPVESKQRIGRNCQFFFMGGRIFGCVRDQVAVRQLHA